MRKTKNKNGTAGRALLKSVTAVSDRAVTVSGCKKIERYTGEEIRLRLCDVFLNVTGSGMTLSVFCRDEIEITGEITSISFDRSGK